MIDYQEIFEYIWQGQNHERTRKEVIDRFGFYDNKGKAKKGQPGIEAVLSAMTTLHHKKTGGLLYEDKNGNRIIFGINTFCDEQLESTWKRLLIAERRYRLRKGA